MPANRIPARQGAAPSGIEYRYGNDKIWVHARRARWRSRVVCAISFAPASYAVWDWAGGPSSSMSASRCSTISPGVCQNLLEHPNFGVMFKARVEKETSTRSATGSRHRPYGELALPAQGRPSEQQHRRKGLFALTARVWRGRISRSILPNDAEYGQRLWFLGVTQTAGLSVTRRAAVCCYPAP